MEDWQIIALYLERNERAIRETDVKYGAYCSRIADNILKNHSDVEECVNDTYYTVWKEIPPKKPDCFRIFLGSIVRNFAISRYRFNHAKCRYQEMDLLLSELSDCIPDKRSVEDEITEKELSTHISDWLEQIAKEDCAVFVRRYWHGETVAELAKESGCSPIRLTQRLLRLRKKLKKYLEQKGVSV